MPWSPIPKFPTVFINLRNKGFTKEVTTPILEKEVMMTIGIIGEKTIKRTIEIMEQLEYIEHTSSPAIWKIKFGNEEKTDTEIIEERYGIPSNNSQNHNV